MHFLGPTCPWNKCVHPTIVQLQAAVGCIPVLYADSAKYGESLWRLSAIGTHWTACKRWLPTLTDSVPGLAGPVLP